MFLNGILTSMETRYGLKSEEILSLEKIDQYLLKKIMDLPSKSPSYGIHLDLGALKIRHILQSRRLMYLHHILTRNKDELISRMYFAQKRLPSKNDWYLTVEADRKEVGLKLSDDEIGSMSKNRFREMVKRKINQLAFDTFVQDKLNHSKGKEAKYDSLSIQKYLKSDQLTTSQKSLLHQLRFKMINVRANYRNMYQDVQCRWCDEGLCKNNGKVSISVLCQCCQGGR